ncbi:Tfp pilus assembly protein PilF [Kibdelosporangium banguiense]|uniref:Tfp pilus assembly protein PilF n=1 Tax=Kibdelosporangium banguiense TaxID=1365924 RepID=A0ABS4TKH9_9PSEU|nr:tetratricopeptide repeat protein [Kibdelosporangium banguiense]MBP2324931.1 Tfp pilus assembly protein PilF [Kibdelosporangium banguiense]
MDVERFNDAGRTNENRLVVRAGVYRALDAALRDAGIPEADCHREDCGDGVLVTASPDVPKALFVANLPRELAKALQTHNKTHAPQEWIRLRMALHAGELHYDPHGVVGAAVNMAFRLVEAPPLRKALASSPGVLALITSSWFYEDVVRQSQAAVPGSYRPVQVTVKETTGVGWISLPDHPYPVRESRLVEPQTASVPRQLPAHSRHFVGRQNELRQLTEMLDEVVHNTGAVVISAIDGTAGIGKTTLAVHWARQVADWFPDGQLYVNLRGFDPAGTPMHPAEAIRGFLDAFEVPAEKVPASVQAQAALYRTLMADRRVLVVLDNAKDINQVRPLLPGGTSCFVVITTRVQMPGLVMQEGASPFTLGTLGRTEAESLLAGHLGPQRLAAELDAVTELVAYCGGLPLALSIVAARAALNPRLPLSALAAELRDENTRLDALEAGDPDASVRTVFSWSYRGLDEPHARMFRLLGLHPGPDLSVAAAASLAGVDVIVARRVLSHLVRANLVEQYANDRFELHDLLRSYSLDLSNKLDTASDRFDAVRRMFGHYLSTACAADRLLAPHRDRAVSPSADDDVRPVQLDDVEQALAWLTAEHLVLQAVAAEAARWGQSRYAWQIVWSLTTFLQRGGHWHDLAASGGIALTAAQQLNDPSAQALMRSNVAHACVRLGAFGDAHEHLQEALELHRQSNDLPALAHVHLELAWAYWQERDLAEAHRHAVSALEVYRSCGHLAGQAAALNDIGWYLGQLGDHREALAHCYEALDVQHSLGDRVGEAATWDSIGFAHEHLGDHAEAIAAYRKGLSLYREQGSRYEQAVALTHLGNACRAVGDVDTARTSWESALALLEHLRHPQADQVRADLETLH